MQLVECPRDAMQGLQAFIPTSVKVAYLEALMRVGFHTIDFGSFVSPKAIPQLKDTSEVLQKIDFSLKKSRFLAIIANERGAKEACEFEQIDDLGFPFSISETFQQRNTNKSIAAALETLKSIVAMGAATGKETVAYISMGFGNPYNDPFDEALLIEYASVLDAIGVNVIALSDTIGSASSETITKYYKAIAKEVKSAKIGLHLHATPQTVYEKSKAALLAGCTRLDGAIKGFGGCPMAKEELTGNMDTITMVKMLEDQGIAHGLDLNAFDEAKKMATTVFPS